MTRSTHGSMMSLGTAWRRLKRDVFDPYRPELHYMRGPGPKCREKWAQDPHIGTQAR